MNHDVSVALEFGAKEISQIWSVSSSPFMEKTREQKIDGRPGRELENHFGEKD